MKDIIWSKTGAFQRAEHEKKILEARNHIMEMVGIAIVMELFTV